MTVTNIRDVEKTLRQIKTLSCLILLFLTHDLPAQTIQEISISGNVKAMRPIHSAYCFLKNNRHVGTVTDSLGQFSLSFPQAFLTDTLIITSIGFEKKEVPLSSITTGAETVHFFLDEQSIMLDEVLIESNRYDLKQLVLKAVANIPNNYPNKRHQMTGLYRKVSTDGIRYTHLEEAAITIEDHSYKKSPSLVKIKTEHFRQTRDWGDVDSFYIKVADKMHRSISQHLKRPLNPLNKLYESNFIRAFNEEKTYFNLKTLQRIIQKHITYELMDVSTLNGDTIYQIAFAESVTPPPPKHASGKTYLKINKSDLAIVEMQFTVGHENQPLMYQRQVKFEKKNGRYYPKYIKDISPRNINRDFKDDELDIRTIWFDNVKVDDFEKIRATEANDPYDPKSYQRRTSSAVFWDSTSLIRKYPLEEMVKKDLEKNQGLEQQFRENH